MQISFYKTFEHNKFSLPCGYLMQYRYGFNGMEKDDEVKGSGNSLDFGARIYDSRLGRWLSVDGLAKKYPHLSPYNFVANSPLRFIDPDGNEIVPAEGLTANELTRVRTALKLVSEKMPEFYSYLNNLKYNPNLNGGTFVSPGQEGYDNEEAFNVVISVGISNIDGIEGKKERLDAFSSSGETVKVGGSIESDLAGNAKLGNAGFAIRLGENQEFQAYDEEGNLVPITSAEQLNNFKAGFENVLKLKSQEGPHFIINLDDFNGSTDVDASISAHELGHVEGFIKFQLNTAYFGTGGRKTNEGHESGNKSGENAEKREEEYNSK